MVVVVEEVRDEAAEEVVLQEGENESDFETDSEVSSTISDDDDFNPADESFYDRVAALKDIVPPQTRSSLYNRYKSTTGWAWWGIQSAGSLAWLVSTSALLVGLPLALAVEDEARVVAQEKEMQMQSAGQQQMLGAPQGQQPQGVLPPGF
ncbi:mitochondrial import receptor subunit tom22 [Cryptococcus neoformans A2-102-5]|nr:mitochondrial import receptor subunit tom22 [Cryptococcus neoformans var. grubii D17-1]OXG92687.1 mitochondrial import receptor subunit tom22 [Cryptococcus neoformans var. grubii A2-102-5]